MDKEYCLKILIVDDSPEQVDIIARTLKSGSYKIFSAANGAECLEILRKENPDIVLLDIILPDVNGKDLAVTIKNDPEFSSIRIILISAITTKSEDVAEGIEKGADDYLIKPIDSRVLLAKMEAVSKIIRAEKELQNTFILNWQTTFDSINDSIFLLDSKGIIKQVNRSTEKLLNKNPKELIGHFCYDIIHCCSDHIDNCPFLRSLKSKKRESIVFPFGEKWFEVIVDPVLDTDGNLLSAVHIMKDITLRKHMEEALKENEIKFRTIFENSVDAIGVSKYGILVFVNGAYLKLFGYTHNDELTNKPILDLIAPCERTKISDNVKRRVNGETIPPAYETRGLRKDGSEFDMDVHVSSYEFNAEIFTFVVLRDITSKKLANELIKRKEAVLRLFVEHSPAAIAMFDNKMKYIVASNRYLTDYDLGKVTLAGRSHYEIFPEMPERWKEIHRSCLSGAVEHCEEDPFPRISGKLDWVRWEICPWYDIDGKIGGIILFSEVITDHKKAEEELKIHREHLEDLVKNRTAELEIEKERAQSADKLKSAFLATMSHELRTPLNSIIGFTGVLLKERPGPVNDEQKKQLGMVQNSAKHLLALINDVLDISKIEAGQLQIVHDQFNLSDIIYKAIEFNKPLSEKKNLQINVSVAKNVKTIFSDQLRVQQIIMNLVNNAIKFTEAGSIRVECNIIRKFVIIRVSDTGIGIEKDQVDKLFMPFMQIDTGLTRQYEGTGLGLSICKRLLDLLNGSIEVKSVPGKGTTFTVKLPMK